MSSLQQRMAALAAGDVVEVPGVKARSNQDDPDHSRSTTPDQSSDRQVSLG